MMINPKLLLEQTRDLDILYVEDDTVVQQAVVKILNRFFNNVDTADNGREGLEHYQSSVDKQTPYDLVLTDINMPSMDGIEMSKEILSIVPEQKIAILSAHNEVEYLHKAVELGVSGFISKPVESDHLLQQLFSICRTVQDKKRYEAYVKNIAVQNKILREQARTKKLESVQEEFLRNISHEIRTPLNAIVGFSSMLKNNANHTRFQEFIGIIEDNSKMIETLVSRIIELSQLKSGTYALVKKDYTLEPLLEQLLGSYIKKMRVHEIAFDYEIESIHNMSVECDQNVVRTVIEELLDNAIKFNHNSGKVKLRVMYDEKINALKIDVKDSGIGMDPCEHKKIFDIFYQVDRSSQRRYEGAGIGLSLVKHMTELNGGWIELQSGKGEGSYFHATLPL